MQGSKDRALRTDPIPDEVGTILDTKFGIVLVLIEFSLESLEISNLNLLSTTGH